MNWLLNTVGVPLSVRTLIRTMYPYPYDFWSSWGVWIRVHLLYIIWIKFGRKLLNEMWCILSKVVIRLIYKWVDFGYLFFRLFTKYFSWSFIQFVKFHFVFFVIVEIIITFSHVEVKYNLSWLENKDIITNTARHRST